MKIQPKIDRKCGKGGTLSHFIGVASELKVAAFFAERRYEVSFPMSSQSRFDFIASHQEQVLKIQVKTITYDKVDRYIYAKSRIGSPKDLRSEYTHDSADAFMFVGDGEMYLIPSENVVGHTSLNFGNNNPNYKPKVRKGSPKVDPRTFKVV